MSKRRFVTQIGLGSLFIVLLLGCEPSDAKSAPPLKQGKYQIAARPEPQKVAAGVKADDVRPGHLPNDFKGGELRVAQLGGAKPEQPLQLPLEHTDVKIDVAGFVARATVVQRYGNPYDKPIEAVYIFPLPQNAAVDAMTMTIGERKIKGEIKRREEARKIYEEAKAAGQRASLLEQERPNIFTQSVANIMPKDRIEITIEYVDILNYEDNAYELVFPMVVGPRYIPGDATGKSGDGTSPDTTRVPDASRITPPVLKPTERSGTDIALSVELDAGMPVQNLYSSSHALDVWDLTPTKRRVLLSPADTVPNKDFVLRYQTAGAQPQVAVLPHFDNRGGFFTLIVQPQATVPDNQVVPRELIFIVDTSGSMSGFPIEKSKEAMRRLVTQMRSSDRFNIVRFSGDSATLWPEPQPYNQQNADKALAFIDSFQGGGGTEMAKGIVEALRQPAAEGYLRLAFLLTDGFVDENEVFNSINTERRGTRIFTLGIGSSPNRYLLDRAAVLGRGTSFYVRQDEDSKEVIDKFFARVDRPALVNLELDWGNLAVDSVYPERIPDLFAGQPLRLFGRYPQGGNGTLVIRGQLGAKPYEQRVSVELPRAAGHEGLASVWARQKVEDLMLRLQREQEKREALQEEVTKTGLEFRLMTQWTSFVAVEEKVVNQTGETKKVVQPVELPDGVDYDGVFGSDTVEGSLANVIGTTGAGSASAGMAGLGIRGAGPMTGGGVGTSRGIAGIGSGGGGYGAGKRLMKAETTAVAAGTPSIMGALPKEVIQKIIAQNRNQIRYCYELELQKNPTLSGKVVVEFVIGADGKVLKVKIKESTLNNANVENCLMARIKTWVFPSPAGGGIVVVTYPFIFNSGA